MGEEFTICRADVSHITKVQSLIDQREIDAFGKINLLNIFERALISLAVLNKREEVIGCACFSDAPDLKFCEPENWLPWFESTVGLPDVSSENSVFAQFITIKVKHTEVPLRELCKTVFTELIEIQNIFMVTESTSKFILSETKPFRVCAGSKNLGDVTVSVARRHEVFPVLCSRMAIVEDNDDLVPLFNSQTDTLRKTYGNYYIAELVEAQNEELKCIVVECERRAVGFISGTRRVDLDSLNEQYDLSILHGLKKPHKDDVLNQDDAPKQENVHEHIKESYISKEEQIELQEPITRCEKKSVGEKTPETWIRRSFLGESNRCSEFIPTYAGTSNAFAIQLYALKPGFESRFVDMLPLLFDQFPGLNYAIICVPRPTPTFPMLRYFARCRVRKGHDPADELYVFHRSGLLRDFVVRRTKHEDKEQIEQLICRMDAEDQKLLLGDLSAYISQGRDTDDAVITSFVAVSMRRVVGVIILRDESEIEWIRAHYNIEEFIHYGHHARNEHATLYHFALAANYHCRRTLFLREVLRLANKTCIYYRILPPYTKDVKYTKSTLITCLSDLVLVRPRRQIVYPPEEILKEKAPEKRVMHQVDDPPALLMSTVKLLSKPRHDINARIVVVGASTTGLAVLETLATCPHLRFNNLVLLSTNGLPGDALEKPDPLLFRFLHTDHCYPTEVLGQYGLRHCVHVVRGKLTGIDRKFKFITIDHKKRLSFDYVVITTGLQYHICSPGTDDKIKEPSPYETPFRRTRRFSLNYPTASRPKNLFLINDWVDASNVVDWVRTTYLTNLSTDELNVPEWKKKRVEYLKPSLSDNEGSRRIGTEDLEGCFNEENKIIVYGYNLDCYTCVEALLECGVPGGLILMVQPPRLEGEKLPFEDRKVSSAVEMELGRAEVRVLHGCTLLEWDKNDPPNTEELSEVTFVSNKETLTIKCKALFCFYEKTVDYDLFMAVNNACFVFDARLAVDNNFHTNDPAVRAAGPVTKLQRIYYNDQWRHELANSQEVGRLLGEELLNLLNPAVASPVKPEKDDSHLLTRYHEPKVVGGRLPGGFNYLYISAPTLNDLANELAEDHSGGCVITTGVAEEGNGYFSLHINKFGTVQTITCLSKKEIPTGNYIQLYNVHAKLLNKLVTRYQEGMITDLYDFLNDVWPLAVYHDRFPEAEAEAHDMLYEPSPRGETCLGSLVRGMLADNGEITSADMEKLKAIYLDEGYKGRVERHLLDFINKNYNTLPMYAKPDLV
ncbi:Cilia- and flagella-associated protein 61 [Clonorchis sinensis]|uniref:Cilia- and flagella-associated protein 61 n=1 Tax=Clonorchis sinensis TaxID=79923 RepID=A0A8T1MRR6_CLOSI|nr:Cilia- and flagella-associated protein 61 [Clonorchis sinensis]